MTVYKHIAHVPVLSHTYKGSIHRAVAMRVVLTEHLSYDTRTLLIWIIACVSDSEHTVKDTAVYRLEAIAHIRQSTRDNHRHTVVDVRGFHLILNVDLSYTVKINRLIFVH